ncbi:MAG: hypothetical protein IJT88_07835 [Kiritimatiellae bacterium]|nr:hypothetical protein [Kiritimatiellia bacterium]
MNGRCHPLHCLLAAVLGVWGMAAGAGAVPPGRLALGGAGAGEEALASAGAETSVNTNLLLPPDGPSLVNLPLRIRVAALEPSQSTTDGGRAATGDDKSGFGITALEVRTPIPNLWIGLRDLSLPLSSSTLEQLDRPSDLIDTFSSSTPALLYRWQF